MDLLADFLAQPRARDAFLLRVVMGRPWKVSVEDEAPLSIVPALKGGAWLSLEGGHPTRIHAGDVLVVRSPTSYVLSSQPGMAGGATIGSGQACSGPDGRDLSSELRTGVRAWGNDPHGQDEMLVGTYRSSSELGRLMIRSLPPWFLVHNPAPELVRLLTQESSREDLGQSSVLDRLLDVLLVSTLRTWLDGDGQKRTSLLSAHRDDVVRTATEAIQSRPADEWSLEALSDVAGVSRASLTRRFNAVLGVSPRAYVTQWRLATGADLLDRSDGTLASVARQVGYSSPFSFSVAFKKHYGLSPREFRERQPAE
ncbi:AraC family transcriptional regulator [Cellulosimicrobium funkei]|nr:AraC family transcriptional regulator [Cellulosimicrobium funkei]